MSRQAFHTLDVLRLEVAVKPTTPHNLVQNGNGELGAWGWYTPLATIMRTSSSGNVLEHVATFGPSLFYSDPMPVTPGHYAAAAFMIPPSVAVPAVTFRIEWLDATQAFISYSTGVGPVSAFGTYVHAATVAPANARFFRLRFDQAAQGTARITAVRAATASTAAALKHVQTNLVTNPSFEVDTAGWEPLTAETLLARNTTYDAGTGVACLGAARVVAGPGLVGATTVVNVTGGRDYTLQAQFYAEASGRTGRLQIRWHNANGVQTGATVVADNPTGTSATQFIPWQVTATAPSDAVTARLTVACSVTGLGAWAYFDHVAFTEGTTVPPYFDGSTAASGTITHAWTGTAHASTSTRTDTALTGLAATEWRNIIGPTHKISTARESLNLGTLDAELLDANLDPATSSTLRPGCALRVLALVGGAWEPTFVGEVDRLVVTYDDKRKPARPPRVSMTGVDRTLRLASATRRYGVATVADLPHVLEGTGVPWDVDGNTGHVLTALTRASDNDSASALDQIALTRDSTGSHAWLDRKGVLVARSTDAQVLANPSFEIGNTTGWVSSGGALTALTASDAPAGEYVGRHVSTGTTANYVASAYVPVIAGRRYRASVDVKLTHAGAPTIAVLLVWYSDTSYLSAVGSGTVPLTTTEYRRGTVTGVAPAGATRARIQVQPNPAAVMTNGTGFYVDDARLDDAIDESRYSDLEVAFASDECINSVTIDALEIVDGRTETIPYGPYEDLASIAQWGRRAQRFTVHGLNAAQIAAHAAAILTRNSTPGVTVRSVTMPMRTSADLVDAIRDLGEIVSVLNTARGISPTLRVTGVEHSIESEPQKWLVTLRFTTSTSVAAPTSPPAGSAAGSGDGTWNTPALQNGWVAHGGSDVPFRYCRINGIVYVQAIIKGGTGGTVVFNMPPGYRPSHTLLVRGDSGPFTITGTGDVWCFGSPTRSELVVAYPADQ